MNVKYGIAAMRGGPFHGERRDLGKLPDDVAVDIEGLLRFAERRDPTPVFPTVLRWRVETRQMPGYGFKADVMPGGEFVYWLRGHQGRVGLYVCEHPMTPADMHCRARSGRTARTSPLPNVTLSDPLKALLEDDRRLAAALTITRTLTVT